MSHADHAEFVDFFEQQHRRLVLFLASRGVDLADAEDIAQTVFMQVLIRWDAVQNPCAYSYQVGKNEVVALAKRQRSDRDADQRWADSQVACSASEDVYHRGDVGIVHNALAILSPRQREVMAKIYAGEQVGDIAEALGIVTSTVRSNLRHGRDTLRPYFINDGQNLHWRAGQQLYEAWQCGDILPVAPRPVISRAWNQAKALGVDPDHGTAVIPLGGDELTRRRRASPLTACRWVLDALTELGKTTEQMMVVADADGVVLWRAGDPTVLRRVDPLGFVEGACWDLKNAGANGIALALATKCTVKVCGWEHYVRAQHGLSCVATPVRNPRDGTVLCVLNLTGTRPSMPHAVLREIDTIAMQLHRWLRTRQIPPPGHRSSSSQATENEDPMA